MTAKEFQLLESPDTGGSGSGAGSDGRNEGDPLTEGSPIEYFEEDIRALNRRVSALLSSPTIDPGELSSLEEEYSGIEAPLSGASIVNDNYERLYNKLTGLVRRRIDNINTRGTASTPVAAETSAVPVASPAPAEAAMRPEDLISWETDVQPLREAINAILNEVDLKEIEPHSSSPSAKSKSELELYQQNLNNAYNSTEPYTDISRYTANRQIEAKIEQLVGRNRLEGQYAQAKKKIEEAIRIAETSRTTFLQNMNPGDMTVNQLVEAAKDFYITSDSEWASRVKLEYFLRNSQEPDLIQRHLNDLEVVLPDSENAGDSEKRDWAADYNKVIGPLGKRGVTLASLYDSLMLKPKEDGSATTPEDVQEGKLKIDSRASELWEYIVGRIKGRDEYDGISYPVVARDAAGKYYDVTHKYIPRFASESEAQYQDRLKKIAEQDQDYSYRNLVEFAIPPFEAHLKLIFADLPKRKLDLLIRFYKTFGAKTAGYQPHLMRAVTRGHGFAVTESSPSDESRFVNPFALIMYNATRYAELKMARYMGRYSFVPKHVFVELVKQADASKEHTAEQVWEIMELFRRALWDGEIPKWLTEARMLFEGPNPEINIDGSIFPLLPELLINIAKVEQEKRDILADHGTGRITDQQLIIKTSEFVKRYEKRGYGSGTIGQITNVTEAQRALRAFGQNKVLKEIDSGQYNLAAEAVDKMFKFFEKPMKGNQSHHDAVATLQLWMSSIIGKAKLIPGDHQLLFAPFTCEVITSLCNTFEHRDDRRLVNKLFIDLMHELKGAGGVPAYAKRLIYEAFGGSGAPGHEHVPHNAPRYCTRYTNYQMNARYRAALWKHHNENKSDAITSIQKAIPFYSGTPDRALDYSLISPYEEHLEKSEDTTKH